MTDRPAALRAAADALEYGPLARLLTEIARAWSLTEARPLSTAEQLCWSGVCERAFDLAVIINDKSFSLDEEEKGLL